MHCVLWRITRNMNNKVFLWVEIIENTILLKRGGGGVLWGTRSIYIVNLTLSSSYVDGIAPPSGEVLWCVSSKVWAAKSRVLVPSQPYRLFAAAFFESGLMIVWSRGESPSNWWLKISVWEVSSWSEQQAWSDALKVVEVCGLGKKLPGAVCHDSLSI